MRLINRINTHIAQIMDAYNVNHAKVIIVKNAIKYPMLLVMLKQYKNKKTIKRVTLLYEKLVDILL